MNMEELREYFSESMRSASTPSPLFESVVAGGKLDTRSALQVYEEGYLSRLTQALGERFETVWRILGDEEFFEVCSRYISGFPSRSYNLSDYGESFPEFLEELFPEHVFLRETAEFELELSNVFHLSENKTSGPPDSISGKDPSDLRLEFHKSLKFLHYTHKIYRLWQNRKSEEGAELPAPEAQYLLVGKTGNDLFVKEINEWEWNFGKNVSVGKTILEAAELSGEPPKGAESISGFLSVLARAGLIERIKIS